MNFVTYRALLPLLAFVLLFFAARSSVSENTQQPTMQSQGRAPEAQEVQWRENEIRRYGQAKTPDSLSAINNGDYLLLVVLPLLFFFLAMIVVRWQDI